jgi:hypothetical protein
MNTTINYIPYVANSSDTDKPLIILLKNEAHLLYPIEVNMNQTEKNKIYKKRSKYINDEFKKRKL